jgi:hypothetical protein
MSERKIAYVPKSQKDGGVCIHLRNPMSAATYTYCSLWQWYHLNLSESTSNKSYRYDACSRQDTLAHICTLYTTRAIYGGRNVRHDFLTCGRNGTPKVFSHANLVSTSYLTTFRYRKTFIWQDKWAYVFVDFSCTRLMPKWGCNEGRNFLTYGSNGTYLINLSKLLEQVILWYNL